MFGLYCLCLNMVTGVGELLLSTLGQEGWERVRNEISRFLSERAGHNVKVSDNWMIVLPILEVYSMNVHGGENILDLLREGKLLPVLSSQLPTKDSEDMLKMFLARSPRLIIFLEPRNPLQLEHLSNIVPLIFVPFNVGEIGVKLLESSRPAITVIPIDFTDVEYSLELLRNEFPEGLNILERFFNKYQDVHDLLQTLGTVYEKAEYNPIIVLAPYQGEFKEKNLIDILHSLLIGPLRVDSILYTLILGLEPTRKTVLRNLTSTGKKILKELRSRKELKDIIF